MARRKKTFDKSVPKEEIGIRNKYSPGKEEHKQLQHVYERYQQMKDSDVRQRAERVWERGRKQWEALRELDRDNEEWQSNHYAPVTVSIIESLLAETIEQSPQPQIFPRGSEDEPKALVMTHTFNYTWDVADSDTAVYDVLKNAFIDGTAIAQEYYWQDPRVVKTTLKDKKKNIYNTKRIMNYDDVYLEPVKLEDFFVDEFARSFDGPYAARDCIRRYIMNVKDAKQFFQGPVWDPLGNAKYIEAGGDTNYYEFYKPPDGINKEEQVEVLWYWSVKPEDWLKIVVNDVMVVMGPNPYKHKQLPFARAIDVKRPHSFYSKGEPELLESIQDETNTLRRMMIDRNHLDIDKMFFVSSRINLSDEDTIVRPHGRIPVDDPNAAKPVEYGDVPRSVELGLERLEDDATISTGVNPRAQALPTAGTATEAAIIKESTLRRIKLKVRLFEREFLTRVGRLRVANILQYYPQPKLEKIVGEAGTAEFKAQMADLEKKGLLERAGEESFEKKFRQIRVEGRELKPDVDGKIIEESIEGDSFFELKPEFFVPSKGGFDIRFKAGSTLPVSKAMEQSKTIEMYDRLIQLAVGGIGYDPVKLGDRLLRVNDLNPNDYKSQAAKPDESEARLDMQLELATTENRLMMEGNDPTEKTTETGEKIAGTPFVSPVHTQVHVAFTNSEAFQNLDKTDPRVGVFLRHILGELTAQESRGGVASTSEGLPPRPEDAANQNPLAQNSPNELSNILPAKVQGGGQNPSTVV